MNSEHEQAINWPKILKRLIFIVAELAIAVCLFAVFVENINQFSTIYLSELAFIGSFFEAIDPEATPSHLIAILMAGFVCSVPLFCWSQILREGILLNPQEWISRPENQIIAGFAAVVLALVISLEAINIYTFIVKQSLPVVGGFVPVQQNQLISFIAENKALAFAISAALTLMNICFALLTANAFLDKD